MQSKLSVAVWTLIFGLVCSVTSIAGKAAAQGNNPHARQYRNENYGYAVRIPAGLEIETSKPPNPNHGFGIKLAPATLWVDASYTDDVSLHAVMASEREIWGDKCQELTSKSTLLGRLPASRIVLKCAGKAEGDVPTAVTLIVALLSQPHNGRIKYEIGSQGPLSREPSVNVEQVFRKVVEGFYLIPRK